ncbi:MULTISPECIES: HD domain-containing phosphohydrolase [Streptacidiphilus]|uniref:HD domain-containing phosphohydrolase n=1 Tax=Streptacidiphilus cavernicola TaxID=3342716 RepID=A0ABV6UVR1_9ACTN|nr:HD domain-containing phosphohydrolase [Streptacidiphilus jeojiense]
MAEPSAFSRVRLAELLAVLSLGADLGMGQPMEHVLRQCLVALRLAGELGLDEEDREVVYYGSLVSWVGCHVDAYEQAKWFGDDTVLKADFRRTDFSGPVAEARFMLRHLGGGGPTLGPTFTSAAERARLGLAFLRVGRRDAAAILSNHWQAADALAAQLGLTPGVRACVEQTFERWDGRGAPKGARGEQILLTARLVNLADVVVAYHRSAGTQAAVAVARERRGTQFDPAVVDAFTACAEELMADLDGGWDQVQRAAPAPGTPLTEAELDAALLAVADFVDVKSPWTIGHSRGVAELAQAAAWIVGLPDPARDTLRRAALVHDLGRLGVPNSVWDKPGPLSLAETERVRLHPYLTERMLACSPALAPIAAVAVQHHERLDGSGYPRGLSGAALTPEGRLLAAADLYQAHTEERAYRRAGTPEEAAALLRAEVRAGRIDAGAAEAVLGAAGHRRPRRGTWPAGLTTREVEVLRLLARGLSTRRVAEVLHISPRTAGHHIEHIYAKTGATNRALAGLFAARHGLGPSTDPATEPGSARDDGLGAGARDD